MDRGTAGASARREYERRKAVDAAKLEAERERVKQRFGGGRIGGVVAALSVDGSARQSTEAWSGGARGETVVGAQLDALAEHGVIALHDRRIPGARTNIDHIAVTTAGVWVIDAKRYVGKRPEAYIEGGFLGFGGTARLKVGGRKKDALIDGVASQVERVQAACGEATPVRGVLCFVNSDWPLIGGDLTIRGIRVVWPKRLRKELTAAGEGGLDSVEVATALAAAFPPA